MKILAYFKLTTINLSNMDIFTVKIDFFFFSQGFLADYTQQLTLNPFAAPNAFQDEEDTDKKKRNAYNVPIILADTAALWEFISLTKVSMVSTPNSYLQQKVIQALCR